MQFLNTITFLYPAEKTLQLHIRLVELLFITLSLLIVIASPRLLQNRPQSGIFGNNMKNYF